MSDSLWPHRPQHARLPCPSLSCGACPNSCLLSRWCHPTIFFSIIHFSCCLQHFPALEYFPISQLFASGGQIIGASASTSVLPMNIQGWFPLSLVQSLSLVQLFATPGIAARPGLPVDHQLPEFTQTHVHRVGDAIQPSHPLSAPSPALPNPSQHQGLFQWVNSSQEVAKVLEFQLQHQSFQWTPRTDLL